MNNIKKARECAGFSQKQVALTLHVSAPTVSDWESGKISPSAKNLKELANLFNVSADYLLGESDVPNKLKYSDKNQSQIMVHSYEPISILFALYEMTVEQFSNISGIPYKTVEYLSTVSEETSGLAKDAMHPHYSELLKSITDEHWERISDFFDIELHQLKDGYLPISPDKNVQEKLDLQKNIGFAAYGKISNLTPEEVDEVNRYIDFVHQRRKDNVVKDVNDE